MNATPREILIVDDDEDIRLLLRKILEGGGFVVHEADAVPQAMGLASSKFPHLIITDLMMDPVSGFDFLKLVSKNPRLAKIPLIVLSALQDKDSVFHALAVGASDYVLKPIDSRTVLQKVKKALRLATFAKFEFPSKELPKIRVKVGAEIVASGENALRLDAPVRIAPASVVSLESAKFPELSAGNCVLKSRGPAAKPEERGRYLNEIAVIKGKPDGG